MARRINETLRKLGRNQPTNEPPADASNTRPRGEERDYEEETQHDRFRRRQARLAERDTSTSLPIEVAREAPKPKPGQTFEGPIDKLIEKYRDPAEVMRHMTVGQYMRYELREGQIWEGKRLVYDGTQHTTKS